MNWYCLASRGEDLRAMVGHFDEVSARRGQSKDRKEKGDGVRIREMCGVTKGVHERTDEGVLRWFGHLERMDNDRIVKKAYAG